MAVSARQIEGHPSPNADRTWDDRIFMAAMSPDWTPSDMIREAGIENASQGYVETNVYGTPEQIVETYAERRKIFGTDFRQCRPSATAACPSKSPPPA